MRRSFAPRLELLETRLTPSAGPYYPDQTTYTPDPSASGSGTGDATYSLIKYVDLQTLTTPTQPPYGY